MVLDRNGVQQLIAVDEADRQGIRPPAGKGPVVRAAAAPEAMAVTVAGQGRNNDDARLLERDERAAGVAKFQIAVDQRDGQQHAHAPLPQDRQRRAGVRFAGKGGVGRDNPGRRHLRQPKQRRAPLLVRLGIGPAGSPGGEQLPS